MLQHSQEQARKLFKEKMRLESLPQTAIDTFLYYYTQLCQGTTGQIPESDIIPLGPNDIEDLVHLAHFEKQGADALAHTVVIKLNGGLGTTMGLQGTKSLIPVKNGLTFLDISALQVRDLNRRTGCTIPLLLMDSFKTHTETNEALRKYSDLQNGLPFSFVQHKFPRIEKETLLPVTCDRNPTLEWNPPGHGDLYATLVTSGLLESLLTRGYEYAFVSNIDNLGATLDTEILGYFVTHNFSFLMEVTRRTFMDRKGGHLAKSKRGKFILREAAQCPADDFSSFSDIDRHRFFNTNNLWINLRMLQSLLLKQNNVLYLPLIRNVKNLDPTDENSPQVFQLESAMGSAISIFDPSIALAVPRNRFAPVKSCEEIMLLWSDCYTLTKEYMIERSSNRATPQVQLDPRYFARIDQLYERFEYGVPSLAQCDQFSIAGDVAFGKDVVIRGRVAISNNSSTRITVPDGVVLDRDFTVP